MNKRQLKILLISCSIALFVSACSDDESKNRQIKVSKSKAHKSWDHSHDTTVSDMQKHGFEHDFAKQCVEREVRQSPDKTNDRKRFTKPCLCIATFMMQDLTAVEAEKFLKEHKSTQSLRIRFENAAYHCLQGKAQFL